MAVTAKFNADFTNFHSAVDTATAKLRSFEGGAKNVQTTLNNSTLSFKQMATAAGAIGAVLTTVTAGVAALGVRGSDIADVRTHFLKLTEAIGESSDAMIGRLRLATHGTIPCRSRP